MQLNLPNCSSVRHAGTVPLRAQARCQGLFSIPLYFSHRPYLVEAERSPLKRLQGP